MNIIKDLFGSGFEIYSFLSQKAKVKDVTKRLLLREIRNNIKRLEHRNNAGVNRFKLIEKLENFNYVKAVEDGFSFNKLAPKQIVQEELTIQFPQALRYIGWNAEKIMNNIDEKIVSLKELTDYYDNIEKASINLTSRLNNLYILLVLLTILIKKSSK